MDAPVFFGGNTDAKRYLEQRFSAVLRKSDRVLSITGPTHRPQLRPVQKKWYFLFNNYIYDMGRNKSGRRAPGIWVWVPMIDTGSADMSLSERLCKDISGKTMAHLARTE